ncbi:MAG: hypothetical protein LUJ09_01465, partial [Firmicutes bacterium]|nr:hypothetical protein [Bacillota bacterium]
LWRLWKSLIYQQLFPLFPPGRSPGTSGFFCGKSGFGNIAAAVLRKRSFPFSSGHFQAKMFDFPKNPSFFIGIIPKSPEKLCGNPPNAAGVSFRREWKYSYQPNPTTGGYHAG